MRSRFSLEVLTFIIGLPAVAGGLAGLILGGVLAEFPKAVTPINLPSPWKYFLWGAALLSILVGMFCLFRRAWRK